MKVDLPYTVFQADSSGYHAGSLELVLPREAASPVNCSISSQWMAENWSKWVYAECMAADVEIVEKTAY